MMSADSTVAGVSEARSGIISRLASRGFMIVLLAICLCGATGLLGGRTATASSSAHGYRLSLSYPVTSRPGLDAFWRLTIVHPGGFPKSVTVALTASYFDLFETQGFYPTPSETTTDGTFVYMTFTPPARADSMTVRYDAYLQPYVAPSNLLANDATVALIVHGQRVAAIPYTLWVLP